MGTAISGINNQDLICGRYTDFAGIRHGFAVCRINAQSELRASAIFCSRRFSIRSWILLMSRAAPIQGC